MTSRLSTLLVLSALFASPALARGEAVPTSTDEARALARAAVLQAEPPRDALAVSVASTTDAARALAGRNLPPASTEPAPFAVRAVSTTDEARSLPLALAALAPAARTTSPEMLADCGKACDCKRQ